MKKSVKKIRHFIDENGLLFYSKTSDYSKLPNKQSRTYFKETVKPSDVLHNGYIVVKEIPLEELNLSLSNHSRLRVFAKKGCKCSYPGCNATGVKLLECFNHDPKEIHVDLYTVNNGLMTIDHIKPKSKGGSDSIDNLQPMCFYHNNLKGNKV